MFKSRLKLTIINGPWSELPPFGAGAMEKFWLDIALNLDNNSSYYVTIKSSNLKFFLKDKYKNVNIKLLPKLYKPNSLFLIYLIDLIYTLFLFFITKKNRICIINTTTSNLFIPLYKLKFDNVFTNFTRMPKNKLQFLFKFDAYLCPSQEVINRLQYNFNINKDKLILFHNAINEEYINIKKKLNIDISKSIVSKKKIYIGYHGRINEEKGIYEIIKSCKNFNYEIIFRLMGPFSKSDGGSGIRYYNKILQAGIENSIHIEYINTSGNVNDIISFIDSLDVYIYPSLAINGETFGLSILEAMSRYKIVIISDLACFNDFVRNNVNGMIIPCKDFQYTFPLLLNEVLSNKNVLIKLNARTTAENYTINKLVNILHTL